MLVFFLVKFCWRRLCWAWLARIELPEARWTAVEVRICVLDVNHTRPGLGMCPGRFCSIWSSTRLSSWRTTHSTRTWPGRHQSHVQRKEHQAEIFARKVQCLENVRTKKHRGLVAKIGSENEDLRVVVDSDWASWLMYCETGGGFRQRMFGRVLPVPSRWAFSAKSTPASVLPFIHVLINILFE